MGVSLPNNEGEIKMEKETEVKVSFTKKDYATLFESNIIVHDDTLYDIVQLYQSETHINPCTDDAFDTVLLHQALKELHEYSPRLFNVMLKEGKLEIKEDVQLSVTLNNLYVPGDDLDIYPKHKEQTISLLTCFEEQGILDKCILELCTFLAYLPKFCNHPNFEHGMKHINRRLYYINDAYRCDFPDSPRVEQLIKLNKYSDSLFITNKLHRTLLQCSNI